MSPPVRYDYDVIILGGEVPPGWPVRWAWEGRDGMWPCLRRIRIPGTKPVEMRWVPMC